MAKLANSSCYNPARKFKNYVVIVIVIERERERIIRRRIRLRSRKKESVSNKTLNNSTRPQRSEPAGSVYSSKEEHITNRDEEVKELIFYNSHALCTVLSVTLTLISR